MARPLRLDFPGGVYHVTARGNERKPIFRDDLDRHAFLGRLADCRRRLDFSLYAYCLMGNHVHLALQRGSVPLSKIMSGLLSFYGQWFNRRHERVGHLFQGRYKSFLVQKDRYLLALLRYVHDNPVKAGLVRDSRDYVWSSERFFRQGRGPDWLDLDGVLSMLGPTRRQALANYRSLMLGPSTRGYEDSATSIPWVKGEEPFAMRMVREAGQLPRVLRSVALEEFAGRVAAAEGLSLTELRGRGRGMKCTRARAIAAFLARREAGVAVARMAKYLGRDESTMVRSVLRLERSLGCHESLRIRLEEICAELIATTMHEAHD